jgi:hypothetical protein
MAFGLDEWILGHRAVKLMRKMDSEGSRLVEHECVVCDKEVICCQRLR